MEKRGALTFFIFGVLLFAAIGIMSVGNKITGDVTQSPPDQNTQFSNGFLMPLVFIALLSFLPIILIARTKKEDALVKQLKGLIERSYAALQKGNLIAAMNNYKVLKGYLETYREKIPRADYNRLMSDSSQLYGYISSKTRMSPVM